MRARWGRGIALGLAVAVLGAALSVVPAVLALDESAGLGWLFGRRGPLPAPQDVAVVGISAASAEAFGLSNQLDEWPRSLHAKLIDRLAAAGAAVIAFDVIFDRPSSPAQDGVLAQSIRRAGNVILLERTRSKRLAAGAGAGTLVVERRVRPIGELERGVLTTAPFTLPAVPVKVSQFWTFGRSASDTPSLPVAVLQAYAAPAYGDFVALLCRERPAACGSVPASWDALRHAHRVQSVMRRIRGIFRKDRGLGAKMLAALRAGDKPARERELLRALIGVYDGPPSRYLNYYGPPRTITTIPYQAILQTPSVLGKKYDVRGKAVFVGVSEPRQPEQQDQFYSVFSQHSGQNLSGVEIGATAFANLLQRDSVQPLPIPSQLAFALLWGFVLALALRRVPAVAAIAGTVLAGVAYLAFVDYRFAAGGVWWPIVVPLGVQLPLLLIGTLLAGYREVQAQRERVQSALGRYVPRHVAARLARESFAAGASREVLHGTCLVADIEHFTQLSETMSPAALGALMNDYYQVLCTAAERYGGLVADISADSMVAIWAGAKPRPDLHRQACSAALLLRDEVARFNAAREARGLPTGFGLDSGELLLGNIGAAQRYEYRAVGDIVNTASRVQGLNRQLGTSVLISQTTCEAVDGLLTRPLGSFQLVGKRSPVSVHELLAVGRGATDEEARRIAAFGGALRLFRGGDFAAAGRAFSALADADGGDGPSRFYAAECERRSRQAPAPGWDGVVVVAVK